MRLSGDTTSTDLAGSEDRSWRGEIEKQAAAKTKASQPDGRWRTGEEVKASPAGKQAPDRSTERESRCENNEAGKSDLGVLAALGRPNRTQKWSRQQNRRTAPAAGTSPFSGEWSGSLSLPLNAGFFLFSTFSCKTKLISIKFLRDSCQIPTRFKEAELAEIQVSGKTRSLAAELGGKMKSSRTGIEEGLAATERRTTPKSTAA
jgi:hypothetical protein